MTRRASSWEGQTLQALKERWDRPHVHVYSRIDSTNLRAKELAEEDAAAGTIVLADEQTAGRGVAGRRWHSPRGQGLYLSLILRPREATNPLLVPLLAGMGTARAIERLAEDVHPVIKWPNDLIVGDRKVGGVLSEASWAGAVPRYLVVGIGLNVRQREQDFPQELRGIAASLEGAAGRRISRLELADLVIEEVEERCANPPASLDRDCLREFDERDWLRDRRCAIEREDAAPRRGTAVGIAPDGALLFRPDRGPLERVTSGRIAVDELRMPEY